MGWFGNQLSNVVEWEENRDDIIFFKWSNKEIKKGSVLFIRPGQDAIFMYNGRIEGIFKDDGKYDIETKIIPFLSTLKGFKFGFNSGIRAEILFVNTKEFVVKWGTKQAINIPTSQLPGGIPIRANGDFRFRVTDYVSLVENIAGVKKQYEVSDIKERVISIVDQLLMKWIVSVGKDMFNLQASSFEILKGICSDLNQEISDTGITITKFAISQFSYPEEIQKTITKVASQGMVGDINRYQQINMIDGMVNNSNSSVNNMASQMMQMQMGMAMGQQMANSMQQSQQSQNNQLRGIVPKFCPECGTKIEGGKFCPNCGTKLI